MFLSSLLKLWGSQKIQSGKHTISTRHTLMFQMLCVCVCVCMPPPHAQPHPQQVILGWSRIAPHSAYSKLSIVSPTLPQAYASWTPCPGVSVAQPFIQSPCFILLNGLLLPKWSCKSDSFYGLLDALWLFGARTLPDSLSVAGMNLQARTSWE